MDQDKESCDPVDFIDVETATLQELYYLAERGVPKAKEIVRRYDQEVDIIMAKAANSTQIKVEWIED